jgi:hypothetical protein
VAAGLILVPYVIVVAFVGTRERIPRRAAWTVVAANALWVGASVLLLMGPWLAPTALGLAFVLAQAAAVALFAELQVMGLRRGLPSAA